MAAEVLRPDQKPVPAKLVAPAAPVVFKLVVTVAPDIVEVPESVTVVAVRPVVETVVPVMLVTVGVAEKLGAADAPLPTSTVDALPAAVESKFLFASE